MAILKDLLVNGPARILGAVFGTSFVKSGGTSSQFLKADGSVDSTSYEPELPSKTGNGGKVLAVNSGATGLEWVTQSGGGGTEDVFMCTFTSNNGTHSMDKTPEEIYQAVVASKKIAICKFNAQIFYCYYAWYDNNSYTIKFSQIQVNGTTEHLVAYIWNTGNTWYYKSGNLQSQLVDSGTNQNIKTINGNSLLGSGDLTIGGGTEEVLVCNVTNQSTPVTLDKTTTEIVQAANSGKEVICIDPNNNFTYRLFAYSSTQVFFSAIYSNVCYNLYANIGTESWTKFSTTYQTQLTSGTTIKTVNGNSLLGSGDIDTSELPSLTNNAGKVLVVNSGATAVEWTQRVTIYSGTSAPSSGTGNDGDIYIQTVS